MFPIVSLGVAIFFGGCAAVQQNEAAQKEKWLEKSGFHMMKADTPEKQAALSRLIPYKIESKRQGESLIYRYVNPVKGCVFVGGPQEYAAYQEISVSTKAKRSAAMAQMTSTNWRAIGAMPW